MKNLIPFLVLSTLIGCNDSIRSRTTITSNDRFIQQYEKSFAVERGMVTNTVKSGEEIGYDFTKASNHLGKYGVNIKTTSVIINIDGDNVYKHQTIQNLITKETSKKIVLEKLESTSDLREILDSQKGTVNGDNLTMKHTEEFPIDLENGQEIINHKSFSAKVNLYRPHCDSRNEIIDSKTLLIDGSEDSSQTARIVEISTCGGKYSKTQMKSLDLKNIELCDFTIDNNFENCSLKEDMSFLTSDL